VSSYITLEQFEEFKASMNELHEQTRKLMNMQAIAIDRKIQNLARQLDVFMSRKPDPTIIRDAWIRQIPKIREELKQVTMEMAQLKNISDKKGGPRV
jgi:predicted oxidoreductase